MGDRKDIFAGWKHREALKATHKVNGLAYRIKADTNGNININLSVRPEALTFLIELNEMLAQSIKDAQSYIELQQQEFSTNPANEKKYDGNNHNKNRRIALSIFRRTGSRKMASYRFDDFGCYTVKLIVDAAQAIQKTHHAAARNRHFYTLNTKEGVSIRNIAKRYKRHPSTIHAIIKREAKKLHPELF